MVIKGETRSLDNGSHEECDADECGDERRPPAEGVDCLGTCTAGL